MTGLSSQFTKFAIIGIMNTVIGYGLYYILLFFKMNYLLAAVVSSVVSILNSFLWNKLWVFRSKNAAHTELIKFAAVYVCGLLLNLALLPFLVEVLHLDPRIAQLLFLLILPFLTFLGLKYWSFK